MKIAVLFLRTLAVVFALCLPAPGAEVRPNILWLVNEDHGPHVGCYGDPQATTPTFDALAARGLRYARCWSNAPVCAPARSTILSGVYAFSSGGEHMRSMVKAPEGQKAYPQLLREAGYYCTNNAKEDYNLQYPGKMWDESSKKAHWKNRPAGVPFMAVFNSEKSHESQIRKPGHVLQHDPAKVRVPAYHPDTPEVRHDWAQYYDGVTAADADAGRRLKELEEAGLAEETIVFYYADHGSGMPGNKRWPLNRGLHAPLVVYIPEKFAHLRPPEYKAGGVSDRLVSFVDLAPTLCSLAGMAPPDYLQGHAFLGKHVAAPQPYLFGSRGRMDERMDCVRSVTDGRFVYVRNFRPDKIYGQYLSYLWETPTTGVWERLFREGKLNDAQSAFWKTKPAEELYDLQSDRDEVKNVAAAPGHAETLTRLRTALHDHQVRVRDVGLLPEGEMHRRSAGRSPYDMARAGSEFDAGRVLAAAERASSMKADALSAVVADLADGDAAVRYWAAVGLIARGEAVCRDTAAALAKALDDRSSDVRMASAEALLRSGDGSSAEKAKAAVVAAADGTRNDVFTVMAALNTVYALGEKGADLKAALKAVPAIGPVPHARFKPYVPRILADFGLREAAEETPAEPSAALPLPNEKASAPAGGARGPGAEKGR